MWNFMLCMASVHLYMSSKIPQPSRMYSMPKRHVVSCTFLRSKNTGTQNWTRGNTSLIFYSGCRKLFIVLCPDWKPLWFLLNTPACFRMYMNLALTMCNFSEQIVIGSHRWVFPWLQNWDHFSYLPRWWQRPSLHTAVLFWSLSLSNTGTHIKFLVPFRALWSLMSVNGML